MLQTTQYNANNISSAQQYENTDIFEWAPQGTTGQQHVEEYDDTSKIFQTDLPNSPKITAKNDFENPLDFMDLKENWTIEQKELLYNYHNLFGNKWSKMTAGLKKSDNCIKNHFYSTERRSLRKLNKYIADKKMKGVKPLPNTLLTKILATAEQKFNPKSRSSQIIVKSVEIKNLLFRFDLSSQKPRQIIGSIQNLIKLILQIRGSFSKRNKNKKEQKSIINVPSVSQNQLKMQYEMQADNCNNLNLHPTPPQIIQRSEVDNQEILEESANFQNQNKSIVQDDFFQALDFDSIQQNGFIEEIVEYFDLKQFQNKRNIESSLFESYVESDSFLLHY